MQGSCDVSGEAISDVIYEDKEEGGGNHTSLGNTFPDIDGVAQAITQLDPRGSVAEETPDPTEHSPGNSCRQ